MSPGNLSESTINVFGFNGTFLDKEEGAANPFEGALTVDVDPGGNRVPEPGTLGLVVAAAMGLGFARRRRAT